MQVSSLTVEILTQFEANSPVDPTSFVASINEIIDSNSQALRDDLSEAAPLFIVREPPIDDRGAEDDKPVDDSKNNGGDRNVGAIVSAILGAMCIIMGIAAAVLHRRNHRGRRNKPKVREVMSSNCSSVASSLSAEMKSSKMIASPSAASLSVSPESIIDDMFLSGQPLTTNKIVVDFSPSTAISRELSGPSLSVTPKSNLPFGGAGSVYSVASDYSELYCAMSEVGDATSQEPEYFIPPSTTDLNVTLSASGAKAADEEDSNELNPDKADSAEERSLSRRRLSRCL